MLNEVNWYLQFKPNIKSASTIIPIKAQRQVVLKQCSSHNAPWELIQMCFKNFTSHVKMCIFNASANEYRETLWKWIYFLLQVYTFEASSVLLWALFKCIEITYTKKNSHAEHCFKVCSVFDKQ